MSTVLHMPAVGSVPKIRPPAIVIIIPCVDKPHLLFCHSLANMAYFCGQLQLPIIIVHQSGSAVQKVRNLAMKYVEEEVEKKQGHVVNWIMHLDSDMTFPQYVLPALMRHDKDIVGCSYVRRTGVQDMLGRTKERRVIDTNKEAVPDLIEMDGLPTGCLLVKRDVFRKIKKPYFRMPWKEETEIGANDDSEYGEDYTFCAMARAAGYQIWLDVHLTKLIGHVSERPLFAEQDSWPALKEVVGG